MSIFGIINSEFEVGNLIDIMEYTYLGFFVHGLLLGELVLKEHKLHARY